MFELHTLKDIIEVPPCMLLPSALDCSIPASADGSASPFLIVVKHCIGRKYIGRVVPRKGYCVAISNIIKCGVPAVLYNGEGSCWCSVVFTVILFRPFVGVESLFLQTQFPVRKEALQQLLQESHRVRSMHRV